MFKQRNIKNHVSEYSCLSVRMFLSILVHSSSLNCFFLILNKMNKYFDVSIQIQESVLVSIAGCLVE